MTDFTRIAEVQILLNKKPEFPVTVFQGPPENVEREVAHLGRNILQPGYAHFTAPEKRLPLVNLFAAAAMPPACALRLTKSESGLVFDFVNAGDRASLRQVELRDDAFMAASTAYSAAIRQMEEQVEALKNRPDLAVFALQALENARRDSHNDGSGYMMEAFRQGGVEITNPTLTNDLAMRFFEMANFLMRDPSDRLPATQADALSRRRPGKFNAVRVMADDFAPPAA